MKIRRSWFYTLAMFILIAVLFLAMTFTVNRIGNGQEYPYLLISNHPRWRVHANFDDNAILAKCDQILFPRKKVSENEDMPA